MAEDEKPRRGWIARNMPTREQIAGSRLVRPFGGRVMRSEYWRFTRRSVPRGVAIGLWVGIFALIPGVQIVGSALLSLPFRANIPVAAGMTFLTNPATTPFLIFAALELGSFMGFRTDIASFAALRDSGAGMNEWLSWLFSDAAPALVAGLFLIATAAAIVSYFASILFWRWWIARKWRRRGRPAPARGE
ncbi:DUF2062 domain-containing protein [Allosphingosinicella sp.]|jgi:hypothetical protein|uniref:DUF2062 domain-containing protein n=1 Tax=Allosphingosinicella sp. TaxID=2823234 RepID=UPI002EFDA9CD